MVETYQDGPRLIVEDDIEAFQKSREERSRDAYLQGSGFTLPPSLVFGIGSL